MGDEPDPEEIPDFSEVGLSDPKVAIPLGAEVFTGLLLNLLMLIAGIGLVRLKGWGRSLSVWLAAAKIVRLALLAVAMAVLVAPTVGNNLDRLAAQQAAPAPGPAPAVRPGQGVGTMLTVYGIAMFVFGSIYPALTLILLTRPAVKAACATPPAPPDGAWS